MPTQTLIYNDTPPSMNDKKSGYGGGHWSRRSGTQKLWQGIFGTLLMATRVPRGITAVRVTANLRFPRAARRDEGNFRMVIEKALGDALTKGGWIPDDEPEHYSFERVEFNPERGPKQTVVVLSYEVAS